MIFNDCTIPPWFVSRFQTDSNLGGIEKLAICAMSPEYGCCPPFNIRSDEISPEIAGLLEPLSVFMVKGWARSFSAMTVMLCAYECEEFRLALPLSVKQ